MIFEVINRMPVKEREEPKPKRTTIHGNGTYISGWTKCHCGAQSTESADPMYPFRWLGRHICR